MAAAEISQVTLGLWKGASELQFLYTVNQLKHWVKEELTVIPEAVPGSEEVSNRCTNCPPPLWRQGVRRNKVTVGEPVVS